MDSKRQCSTCQFFQKAHLSGNGWCTHPKRQVASDLKILVRDREIACRNTWGDDLWVGVASLSATTQTPGATPRKGFHFGNQRADDEVTSVGDRNHITSVPAATQPEGSASDDMVTFTSVRPEEPVSPTKRATSTQDDHNAAAIADQDERVRHLARGSRDAIFHARERMAHRRIPTRPMIPPDGSDDRASGDRVLSAQHRDAPNNGAVTGSRASEAAGGLTPPVPRSEVEARSDHLSPAAGADLRFDSIPEVKPEVDLPRLREFFRTDQSNRRGSDASVAPPSAFDLVLRRAQEIQAASAVARDRPATPRFQARGAPRQVTPEDEPAEPDIARSPEVVWDVDREQLNVVFERARAAIDDTPTGQGNSTPYGQQSFDALEPDGLLPDPFDAPPIDDATSAREFESACFDFEEQHPFEELVEFGSFNEDRFDEVYSDTSYVRSSKSESPRASWWRSLNFGIRRRYFEVSTRAEGAMAANDYETLYEEDLDYLDSDQPDFDQHLFDADWENPGAFDRASDTMPPSIAATSHESWVEDTRQFPDPQPAAWHEDRATLLAGAVEPEFIPPIGRTAAVEAVRTSHTHRQQDADDRVEAVVPPDRPVRSFFAIDEPGGMADFRAALFKDRNDRAISSEHGREQGPARIQGSTESPHWALEMETSLDMEPGAPQSRLSTFEPRHQPSRQRGQAQSSSSYRANNQAAFDSDFNIGDAISDREQAPDKVFQVASRVPKSCGTCRSFRPSETGDCGWCMNHDAPTFRQMVDSDVLTCKSSIGVWWLAADTSWIPPIASIRPGTPRTDRLVARSLSINEPEAHDEQRVRTRNFG